MHDIRALGAKIRKIRIEKDLRIQDIANEMNWSYWDYSSLENGWLLMSYKDLEKLAEILKTSVKDLMEPLSDDEYKNLVLRTNKDTINSVELLDAILDRIDDMLMVEIARVEERLESSIVALKKEITRKSCEVLDDSEEGDLPL